MDAEIKIWNYRKLRIQSELGRGAFGTVYLAHCDEPEPGMTNPVVMKVLHQSLGMGEGVRKLFMKEAKLLTGLHHENIVRMHGICENPLVIILEYVVFDFNSFGRDIKVNTVDRFLSEFHQMSRSVRRRLDHLIPTIAMDITKGLSHLHQHDIAHRDLKPSNVLISNQHCDPQDSRHQIKRIKTNRPVVCKLADFGESRSQLLQTSGMNDPGTNQVFRGTIAFMAPEIILPERQGKKLSLDDLKKVDVWALGLTCYCLINPSVLYPYDQDGYENMADIFSIHRQRRRPSSVPEYRSKQSSVWARVKDVYHHCTNHDSSERPKASEVVLALAASRDPAGNPGLLMTNETPLRQGYSGASSQWYASEQGQADVKYTFDRLTEIADSEVTMSRKTETQNLSMSFQRRGQQWQVKFPPDFPRSNSSVCTNGEICAEVGGDTIRSAVRAIISAINHAPAKAAHYVPVHMSAEQWYGGEQGEANLRYVSNALTNIADGDLKMSRKTDTQDITLSFQRHGQHWKVKFPSNFPRSDASLSCNGECIAMVGGDTVETAIRAMIDRISSADQRPDVGLHGNAQWYEGEHGEATLKYVFSELEKLANSPVEMSRKTDTQDITLCFYRQEQEWQVKFPCNFPSSNASLFINRKLCTTIGGDTVDSAVRGIVNHITSTPPPQVVMALKLCTVM